MASKTVQRVLIFIGFLFTLAVVIVIGGIYTSSMNGFDVKQVGQDLVFSTEDRNVDEIYAIDFYKDNQLVLRHVSPSRLNYSFEGGYTAHGISNKFSRNIVYSIVVSSNGAAPNLFGWFCLTPHTTLNRTRGWFGENLDSFRKRCVSTT